LWATQTNFIYMPAFLNGTTGELTLREFIRAKDLNWELWPIPIARRAGRGPNRAIVTPWAVCRSPICLDNTGVNNPVWLAFVLEIVPCAGFFSFQVGPMTVINLNVFDPGRLKSNFNQIQPFSLHTGGLEIPNAGEHHAPGRFSPNRALFGSGLRPNLCG
jgi:hypothetical protein